ncbi:MAG TPA: YtxH domain-containing protein [Nitrolancea sp.]|nr:YtxH domain-containing protein [Nitrolancea sp.]
MLGRMRVALKFMTVGMLLGVILAPRSGAETRHEITDWVGSMTKGMFGGSNSTSM